MLLRKNLFLLLGLSLILFPSISKAQRDWTVPFGAEQVFIENQGQYDGILEGEQVQYGIDHGFGWKVLMTAQGARLISQKGSRPQEAHEMAEEMATTRTVIAQSWLGMAPSVQIEAVNQRPDYFTYSYETAGGYRNLDQVPAWTELHFRGIYPLIDLVYSAPAQGGLKYTLHLAAGADPAQIRLQYSGASVSLDPNGNLQFPTVLGDLVDHAPTAHYADGMQESIPCNFLLQGNEVHFNLGTYDPGRPVTIDPWTVNPALPAPFNRAFEVDADAAGNVYVFGGGMGYNLKKYNAAGALQWTHVSPWDTSNAWFGELLVLPAGDVFITSGSAAKLRRLTTAGATTFTNNGPFFNVDEYWTLSLNCDDTKLISGGSRIISFTSPQGHIFNINMANGNQLAGSPVNVAPTGMNEVRGFNRSTANGMLFALSNNNLIGITNTLTTTFNIANGYSLPYYSPAFMAQSVQGVNAVAANANFLYTSNGATLHGRNPSTGAIVNTVAIPGGGFTGGFLGSGATNSGLAIDNCGNVYVGSSNQVLKYNAALVQQATVATTGAIYDVVVAPGGVVIWGGNGLVTSNTSLAACVPVTYSCIVLPVELAYWRSTCNDGQPSLEWSATEEAQGTQYAVEYSPTGAIWETLLKRDGAGPGKEYRIENLPETGWQYRLRITDPNGDVQYSMVETARKCGAQASMMTVWPTRTAGDAQLMLDMPQATTLQLSISNSLGQTVSQEGFSAAAGMGIHKIDLEAQASGIYFIRLTDKQTGILVGAAKIVKE